ncbi:energy transducer TonB [Thermocrinis sp.]|jgi:protein TonB|uniref:energy transducer TonB n=1 Tax=Thermocrinis sp. TaxID=2024383 RepID=UPI003C088EEA
MREIFKAYSLSFLIHSLLLFGFFLLTQRLAPSEKRLIEIDLSLENVQIQPSADLSQKAQPLPARPPQTQPVPQATIPPTKEEIKSSTTKQLKQEERLIQATSPPKPAEAEIREIQTTQVQTAPQPKEETKSQTAEHPRQGESSLQAKETFQKPGSQEREGKDLQVQTNKSVESASRPTSSLTDESRRLALEESFLRERLSVISNIVQRHINYPPVARRMGWEGRVLIGFILEPNGDIRDLKVLKSSGYEVLDKEALDAIRRSYRDFPKPPVSVVVKLPINFRLE